MYKARKQQKKPHNKNTKKKYINVKNFLLKIILYFESFQMKRDCFFSLILKECNRFF